MRIKTETHGQAAEKVICDLSGLDSPNLTKRSDSSFEEKLTPLISGALKELPRVIRHSGLEKGLRGGQSKSKIDFHLEGNQSLSVKCYKSSNPSVCAPEVGQASWEVLEKNYKDLLQENNMKHLNEENYKLLLYNSIHKFVPIQLSNLFSCDFLLFIHLKKKNSKYKIISKKNFINVASNFIWKFENFRATKEGFSWTKSINYRYKDISLINAQLHGERTPMKFRFYMNGLCKILNL